MKNSVDKKGTAGAYLSKAFDCLNHELLVAKLNRLFGQSKCANKFGMCRNPLISKRLDRASIVRKWSKTNFVAAMTLWPTFVNNMWVTVKIYGKGSHSTGRKKVCINFWNILNLLAKGMRICFGFFVVLIPLYLIYIYYFTVPSSRTWINAWINVSFQNCGNSNRVGTQIKTTSPMGKCETRE